MSERGEQKKKGMMGGAPLLRRAGAEARPANRSLRALMASRCCRGYRSSEAVQMRQHRAGEACESKNSMHLRCTHARASARPLPRPHARRSHHGQYAP